MSATTVPAGTPSRSAGPPAATAVRTAASPRAARISGGLATRGSVEDGSDVRRAPAPARPEVGPDEHQLHDDIDQREPDDDDSEPGVGGQPVRPNARRERPIGHGSGVMLPSFPPGVRAFTPARVRRRSARQPARGAFESPRLRVTPRGPTSSAPVVPLAERRSTDAWPAAHGAHAARSPPALAAARR